MYTGHEIIVAVFPAYCGSHSLVITFVEEELGTASTLHLHVHVLMRDEKEGRSKQGQTTTRQCNTAHPREYFFLRKMYTFYMYIESIDISLFVVV